MIVLKNLNRIYPLDSFTLIPVIDSAIFNSLNYHKPEPVIFLEILFKDYSNVENFVTLSVGNVSPKEINKYLK